jgi:regulator of sirC expression with transglutaminase-like and TPR domain
MISREPIAAAARFRDLIDRSDDEIDLAEAALLIAKGVNADLDVAHYLARIEALAGELARRFTDSTSQTDRILALNQFLFEEQGFAPSIEDYYDPRNSFLNEVLERRVGIPISLSVLYIEVGRRAGLPLSGVSFPGHFLVKCKVNDGLIVLDPYCRGVSLSLHDLQQRLREVRGGEVSRAIVAGMLVAANKKQILARMLRNLKAIYLEREDYNMALSAMEWIIALTPADALEVRDRGLLYAKLECARAALDDLQRYLELAPDAEDVPEVRSRVIELRQAAARLN